MGVGARWGWERDGVAARSVYDGWVDRRVVLVLLLLVAGCQDILSLSEVTAGPQRDAAADAVRPVDVAPADAGPLRCATSAPTLFCADFDEMTPVVYEQGVPVAIQFPAGGAGVVADVMASGVSPPSALHVDSTNAAYSIDDHAGGSAVGHLHATFWLNIARDASNAIELVEIGNDGGNDSDCVANLQYEVSPPSMQLMTSCGGSRVNQLVLSGIPSGWQSYALDFDVAMGRATLTIGGSAQESASFAHTPVAGPALVRIGVLDSASTGPDVTFDDVVVTASP